MKTETTKSLSERGRAMAIANAGALGRPRHPFFMSNLAYHFALERTNPALAKALAEKGRAQEHRLEVNAHRTITFLQDLSRTR